MGSWGEQFSSGDQGAARRAFYDHGRSSCPQCQSTEIGLEKHVAGCRHNGDGYGTEVFTCNTCQWSTSFQYDEAGDCYYYEMRSHPSPGPAVTSYEPITVKDRQRFFTLRRLAPAEQVRSMMTVQRFDPAHIDAFLREPLPAAALGDVP